MESQNNNPEEKNILIIVECKSCLHKNNIIINGNNNHKVVNCEKCHTHLFDTLTPTGYIYVLSNPALPNMYKIGYTNNDPEKRVQELNSSTSIPDSFKIELLFYSNDPFNQEQKIHKFLNKYRYNNKREFFSCNLWEIYSATTIIIGNNPIINISNFNQKNELMKYNPWSIKNIKPINSSLKSMICPFCKNTTRKHHQNKHPNASFYCKRCKKSFDHNGFEIK